MPYRWCGDHWRATKLPVRIRVNAAGAGVELGLPEAQAQAKVVDAVKAAVLEWERAAAAWPIGPSVNPCPAAQPPPRLICYVGTTTKGNALDDVNTVLFDNLGPTGPVARAYLHPEGQGTDLLRDVDIVLNTKKKWMVADTTPQIVKGEAGGALAGYCPEVVCVDDFDIQNAVTHELGHAIGLEHVGQATGDGDCVPAYPEDVLVYRQTMYGCIYQGETSKRTLEEGDRLGVYRVLAANYVIL